MFSAYIVGKPILLLKRKIWSNFIMPLRICNFCDFACSGISWRELEKKGNQVVSYQSKDINLVTKASCIMSNLYNHAATWLYLWNCYCHLTKRNPLMLYFMRHFQLHAKDKYLSQKRIKSLLSLTIPKFLTKHGSSINVKLND